MREKFIHNMILILKLFIVIISFGIIANAETAELSISLPDKIVEGENFEVLLIVPENTYGIQADIAVKFSDGSTWEYTNIYIEDFTGEQAVTVNAKVAGTAEIVFSNIVLGDSQGNYIEAEKTKSITFEIQEKKKLQKIKIDNPIIDEYKETGTAGSSGTTDSPEITEISSYTWELGKYGYMSFGLMAYPTDVTDIAEVEWTTSNESIIRLELPDSNSSSSTYPGYTIPGYGTAKKISSVNVYTVSPGTATITAKCGDLIDTYTITVVAPIKEFKLDKESTWLYYNEENNLNNTVKLNPIINPENTTDDTTISWATSDSSVVMVTDGVLSPVGTGTASVIACCGNFTASCEVTVTSEVIKGDVTADGKLKIYDAFQILKEVLIPGTNFNEIDTMIRDYDSDGKVKMYDAFQFLKQAILG